MFELQEKQTEVFNLFDRILKNDTLKHAYLFEGNSGIGKLEMARYIAKSKLCSKALGHEPCLECSHCQRIASGEHPDVVEVRPENPGGSIKVDRIRELKKEFTTSGVETNYKMIIVDQVESMTISAANSLLKFIEEPDGDITIFLLTSNRQQVLPTIISRCQVIPFKKQAPKERIKELEQVTQLSNFEAHLAAHLTQDTQVASELAEGSMLLQRAELVWRWFNRIAKGDTQAFILIQEDFLSVMSNRNETDLILDLALYLYRDLLKLHFDPVYDCLAFSQYHKDLSYFTETLSLSHISNGLTAILKAKRWLKSNVSSQAVLEDLTLELLNL